MMKIKLLKTNHSELGMVEASIKSDRYCSLRSLLTEIVVSFDVSLHYKARVFKT